MSSRWAHEEQDKIMKINPKGLLVPVLFYGDGVTAGMNGKSHLFPVIMTLGIYDDKLRKEDVTKNVVGFIDNLSEVSEESLILHLMEFAKLCKTTSEENVKYYKKQIVFKFWESAIESLKAAANRGMLVKILGHEEPKLLFPRIAFIIGDDPAQHEVTGIKCGSNVKHGCIQCMYNSRSGRYDPNRDTLRDMSIVEQIRRGSQIYQKHLTGDKNSEEERNLIKDLRDKGYHPIVNPFFNAPFGENNHIYNTPTDLMHLFSSGLIKSVLTLLHLIVKVKPQQ
jgi:hypothetical protein